MWFRVSSIFFYAFSLSIKGLKYCKLLKCSSAMFPVECSLVVPVSSLMKGDRLAQSKFFGVIDLNPNFYLIAFSLLAAFRFFRE
jgi:hypothetical protein